MAEHDTGQERTEQPTPKRLREAREKGQVARSRDFNSTAVMVLGSIGLLALGGGMILDVMAVMEHSFTYSRERLLDPATVVAALAEELTAGLLAIVPFLVLMLLASVLAPLLLGGWSFSSEQLAFKPDRLDPVKGLKRIFGLQGLVELLKAMGKFLVVAVVGLAMLWLLGDQFFALAGESLHSGLLHGAKLIGWCFLAMSGALVLIAAVDVPYQLWDHQRKLKMTLQEVRDEIKETEGRPEVRQRIRSIQQQMARSRMMAAVPEADVVITNPTHYAVALRYDQQRMAAPVVVAKGSGLIALRIREVAEHSGVALFESPQLARVLYATAEINDEIPEDLYLAVAQVLAFVFQLQQARRAGAEAPRRPEPDLPEHLLDDFARGLEDRQ